MKTEIEEKLPPILDNVLFTKINEQLFGKSKASEGIRICEVIAADWGLNLKRNKHFKISRKIIINSIKNN